MRGIGRITTRALGAVLIALAVAGPAFADDLGDGVEAFDGGDYAEALAAWTRASDAGNTQAMSAIANLYRQGLGVRADPARAAAWYRRAAERGDAVAQLNLGDMYAGGTGVSRDPVAAYVWLGLAGGQGHAWAAERRDEIGRALTTDDRASAEARIRAWRAKTD